MLGERTGGKAVSEYVGVKVHGLLGGACGCIWNNLWNPQLGKASCRLFL